MNAEAWVAVATAIFAVVAYSKGRKPLLAMLDARTARVKSALDEAERLKHEAEALLADSQKKHRDALQTAQKIVDHAKETSERIQKEAEEKMEQSLKRREAQLMDRITRAEEAAVQQIRNKAVDLATGAAAQLLEEAMTKRGAKLVDDAISDIPARLN